MSDTSFVKGSCSHCGGHLEFPAHAAGNTVNCPHCSQPTELTAPVARRNKLKFLLLVFVTLILAVAPVSILIFLRASAAHKPEPKAVAIVPQENIFSPLPDVVSTNDFAIATFDLEKKPGTSLVYVTGNLRNLAPRQRFGVRVEFTLLDRDQNPVGTAKDYAQMLEANGAWVFKAMVFESKAVSATFASVREDR